MKKIFCRLNTSDLIKQITVVALFMALAITFEKMFHLNLGILHLCLSSIVASFLMISFADWRISLLGSILTITLGELVISGHQDFWTNYIPILLSTIIIHLFKYFKKFWLNIAAIIIGVIQFELFKSLIVFLSYGSAKGYIQIISGLVQIGIGMPIVLMIYSLLFKVMKSMNTSFYSYI